LWCEVLPGASRNGPALFLDRDGVIVEEVEYLQRVNDIRLISGVAAVIAAANQREIAVVMVTNQAGIGRGYYGWPEFSAVQDAILSALVQDGARIDAVYACAHHPSAVGPYAHSDHPWRKPNPGMLLRAAGDLNLELGRSWLVGDKAIDIEAARRARLAGAMHVATGHGRRDRTTAVQFATPNFQLQLGQSVTDALALPLLDGGEHCSGPRRQ
jgi:D-glycero-D-manno-heptose 1,7-bisphosphate phosphatase